MNIEKKALACLSSRLYEWEPLAVDGGSFIIVERKTGNYLSQEDTLAKAIMKAKEKSEKILK